LDVYGPQLLAAGIHVDTLDMPRGMLTPRGIVRLGRILSRQRPDVVQTWMYHADLVGGLVGRGLRIPVLWNLRNSDLDPMRTSFATRLVVRFLALLGRQVPVRIVSCSQKAIDVHSTLGYPSDRFDIIHNGFDCLAFNHDQNVRRQMRTTLGIKPHTLVLGMVARWDPQKDHANLLAALARLARSIPEFCCVLVGHGMSKENLELYSQIQSHGLSDRVLLLGLRNDIPAVMNAFDLKVLSSAYGEAFPNVLAEAMACGVPCVTTRVGDAGLIVGDTGWVVPPGDAEALAEAIAQALRARQDGAAWQGRQFRCRDRIVREFSLDRMARSYHDLWRRVARRRT